MKRTGLAVDWLGYLHILGHQKYGSHLLLLPDFLTGLEVCAMLIGARKKRYLCSRPFSNEPAQVYVRGF